MEDILDYIYIIFIALFFLLRPLLKKKKNTGKQVNQPHPESKPKTGQTFEDVIGELMGETKEEPPKPIFEAPKPAPIPVVKKTEKKEASPDNPYMEYLKTATKRKETFIHPVESMDVVEIDDEDEDFDFDIREAIIYSTILERKY